MIFLDTKKIESKKNKFLKVYGEKENFNQYWFSENTIDFIVKQIEKNGIKVAFVSTPSVFFSVKEELQKNGILFDYDDIFSKKTKNAVKFDYREYDKITDFDNTFDFILVDPPYINEEAWTKYSEFVKKIAKTRRDENNNIVIEAKILTCSIAENQEILSKLLNLKIRKFQPSIPNLVYQYNFFSNYEDEEFEKKNEEIIE